MSDFATNGNTVYSITNKDSAIYPLDAQHVNRADLERELALYKQREEFLCQYIVQLEEEVEREYTRREQAETTLQDREALLKQVIEHTPNATALFDKNMVYMLVSNQFLTDYHVAEDDIIERNHYDIFPDVPQRWRDIFERCLAGAVEFADEDSFVRLDGTVDYNCWECRPWYDANDEIGGIVMYSEMISERKQADEERQQLTEALQRQAVALRRNQALLQSVIDYSPAPLSVNDMQGNYMLVNRYVASMLGCNRYEVIGKADHDFFPEETVRSWREQYQQIFATGQAIEVEETLLLEDGLHTVLSVKFPISNDQGDIYAIGGISTDITERKRDEEERIALQQQIIEMQQDSIRELSTPLLPLAKHVIAMPLVGNFDTARVRQVVETLLQGVADHRARTVILDITGVSIIDTTVADALIQATQAVRLLGAHVVLTGVQPRIAQTIVEQGIDMRGVMTYSTLHAGIAYALRT